MRTPKVNPLVLGLFIVGFAKSLCVPIQYRLQPKIQKKTANGMARNKVILFRLCIKMLLSELVNNTF